jgi:hypothetical protein
MQPTEHTKKSQRGIDRCRWLELKVGRFADVGAAPLVPALCLTCLRHVPKTTAGVQQMKVTAREAGFADALHSYYGFMST